MSNKTELEKEVISAPDANVINKSGKENTAPDNAAKKVKKPVKKSSVEQIDAAEGSALGAVKANSSRTVRGSSGLANTGTIISYD